MNTTTTTPRSNATASMVTPIPYSMEWRLAYAAGKLGLIPAFGDSIGKDVNKAELALCAKYVAQAKDSHAQLVEALEAMTRHLENERLDYADIAAYRQARAALTAAQE